ncbi:MAG: NusG domain II-containing protein [Suipraeoptans sp.]
MAWNIRKKIEFLIIGIILSMGIAFMIYANVNSEESTSVIITVNQIFYGKYNLNENQTISIQNQEVSNTLIIENGQIYMEHANCPDGYCITQGKKSRSNESIICLPNEVVVEVQKSDDESNEETMPDVIAK